MKIGSSPGRCAEAAINVVVQGWLTVVVNEKLLRGGLPGVRPSRVTAARFRRA
jgi:hypothetical protein